MFTKIISLKIVLLFILIGCDGVDTPSGNEILGHDASLTLIPSVAFPHENVTLSFPKNHPKSIAVRTPAGEWYTVHDVDEGIFLIPDKEFFHATTIAYKISEVKGIKWVEGKKITGPVFTVPGKYMIYMADNLETEPENTFFFSTTLIIK